MPDREVERLTQRAQERFDRGDDAGAERDLREVIGRLQAAQGPEHPDLAPRLNALGILLARAGRLDEAEAHYRRAFEIWPPTEPPVGCLGNLADLHRQRGELELANELYEQIVDLLGEDLPPLEMITNMGLLCFDMGDYAQAERLFSLSLNATEEGHPNFAMVLSNLAMVPRAQGRFDQALELNERALGIWRASLGEDHPQVAKGRSNLGALLVEMGRPQQAEEHLRKGLEMSSRLYGPEHPDTVLAGFNLAALCLREKRFAEAEDFARRFFGGLKKHYGRRHPIFAASLNVRAELAKEADRVGEAEDLHRRALEIRQQALGDDHPQVAESLNNLARLLCRERRFAEAEPLFRRQLEIERRVLGEDHPRLLELLVRTGHLYENAGRFQGALELYRQALDGRRRVLGEEHAETAATRGDLGDALVKLGRYAEAETAYRQALEVEREVRAEGHPNLAWAATRLGLVLHQRGRYDDARRVLKDALELQVTDPEEAAASRGLALNLLALVDEATGHPRRAAKRLRELSDTGSEIGAGDGSHTLPLTGLSLGNMALMAQKLGDFRQAEQLHRAAIEAFQDRRSEDPLGVAAQQSNLAMLHLRLGHYREAERVLGQSMATVERFQGRDSPAYAIRLSLLAGLRSANGDPKGAGELLEEAASIFRRAVGEEHPLTLETRTLQAIFLHLRDHTGQAEEILRRVIETREESGSGRHAEQALNMMVLGEICLLTGRLTEAEEWGCRARDLAHQALGPEHPDYGFCLAFLVRLQGVTGRRRSARALLREIRGIDDGMIRQVFSMASENQRTAFLAQAQANLDLFLAFALAEGDDPEVVSAAFDLTLRRKAIGAEASAVQWSRALTAAYPHLETEIARIVEQRQAIVRMTLDGRHAGGLEAHREAIDSERQKLERMEGDLVRQIPEMDLAQRLAEVDRDAVARALPSSSALIEVVRFDAFDFDRLPTRVSETSGEARYAAFVLLAGEPDGVVLIDLGQAEPIDTLIADFHRQLAAEEPWPPEPAEARLERAVFAPLRPALGGRRRLIVAPDGSLTRLPFEILPTAEGDRRVIDDFTISYVAAGRDVLRFRAPHGETGDPVVIADPDFDLGSEPASRALEPPHGGGSFERLEATRKEGKRIAELLQVRPWLGADALERRLKDVVSPRVLHLATHGFFLPDQDRDQQSRSSERLRAGIAGRAAGDNGERLFGQPVANPQLRSGLALAGVNSWLRGGLPPAAAEDGLLLAEDVTGMSLLHTELVVLSACETGLADVRSGEGVMGLRRAFTVAGARSLVMSLWQVPDTETRELMIDFYQRLKAGVPKARALRQAQLAMKARPRDFAFWGAFICQGDPGPLAPEPCS